MPFANSVAGLVTGGGLEETPISVARMVTILAVRSTATPGSGFSVVATILQPQE